MSLLLTAVMSPEFAMKKKRQSIFPMLARPSRRGALMAAAVLFAHLTVLAARHGDRPTGLADEEVRLQVRL